LKSDRLNVGVVGAGHMGRHHARIYGGLECCKLVAVIDKDLDRARKIATEFGGEPAQRVADVRERLDAVTVAVPTVYHAEVAIPLLERGVSVLVEKPLAPDSISAKHLLDASRTSNGLLQVGHSERFNPVVQAMIKLAVTPRFIETHRISPFTFRSADIGVVFDMMIHDIDIVLHLVGTTGTKGRRDEGTEGEATERQNHGGTRDHRAAPGLDLGCTIDAVGVNVLGVHEDVANARLRFGDQTVANLTASRLALKTERKIRVFCPTAYLSMDYQQKSGIAIKLSDNLDLIRLARERNFDDLSQMQHFDFGSMVKIEPLQVTNAEPLRAEIESFLTAVRARLSDGATTSAHAKEGRASFAQGAPAASPRTKGGAKGVGPDPSDAPPTALAAASAEEGYAAVALAEQITRAVQSQDWSSTLAARLSD